MPRIPTKTIFGAAALILLLSGCADAESPASLAPLASNPSPTTEVSPPSSAPSSVATAPNKDPSRPTTESATGPATASGSEPAEQSVEDAIRRYFALSNEAFQGLGVQELNQLSITSCPCRKFADHVEKIYQSGGRVEGARYVLESVQVHNVTARTAGAVVVATVSPYQILSSTGDVIEDSAGGALRTDFTMALGEKGWVITNSVNLG